MDLVNSDFFYGDLQQELEKERQKDFTDRQTAGGMFFYDPVDYEGGWINPWR